MFTIHISNGYRIAKKEGGWNYVETEKFVLTFEEDDPPTTAVMDALRSHLAPREIYRNHLNRYLFLTDEKHELQIFDSHTIKEIGNRPQRGNTHLAKIIEYGVKSGDTLYLASDFR